MTPQPPHRSTQLPDTIASDPRKLKAVTMIGQGARLSMDWEEIAQEIGVTRRTLFEWRKADDFKEAVLILARESLADAVPVAYARLEGCLRSGDTRSALRAGELILRASGVLVDRVETQATFNPSRPDAKSILESLRHEIEEMEGA
jgi:hypothetical protein